MILFTILFVVSVISGAEHSFADIKTLQETAQYSDPLVPNGKGTLSYVWVREDSASAHAQQSLKDALESISRDAELVWLNQAHGSVFFAFNGPKVRCDEKAPGVMPGGIPFKRHWQSAYNGEKMDFFRLDGIGKGGLIKPFGSIRDSKNIVPYDRFDPRYHAMTILGTPVGTFLNGTAKEGPLSGLVQKEDQTVDGVSCHVIEGAVTDSKVLYTVWIAPDRMYRPVKIEVKTGEGVKVVRNQFALHPGDVWFPKKTVVEDYYRDSVTGNLVLSERYTLTVADDYTVNTDVPDALFSIAFPKGLSVYDWRTGTSFKVE